MNEVNKKKVYVYFLITIIGKFIYFIKLNIDDITMERFYVDRKI